MLQMMHTHSTGMSEEFHAKLNLHTNNRFVCTIKHIECACDFDRDR
jgi:hypothetical protein